MFQESASYVKKDIDREAQKGKALIRNLSGTCPQHNNSHTHRLHVIQVLVVTEARILSITPSLSVILGLRAGKVRVSKVNLTESVPDAR